MRTSANNSNGLCDWIEWVKFVSNKFNDTLNRETYASLAQQKHQIKTEKRKLNFVHTRSRKYSSDSTMLPFILILSFGDSAATVAASIANYPTNGTSCRALFAAHRSDSLVHTVERHTLYANVRRSMFRLHRGVCLCARACRQALYNIFECLSQSFASLSPCSSHTLASLAHTLARAQTRTSSSHSSVRRTHHTLDSLTSMFAVWNVSSKMK